MVNELMYDLNLISKYRTPLMGIAALMIILCHAPQYGVAMPNSISSVMLRGGLGVDIFLYLSGVGCWYSLSKGVTLKKWYCKRFIRIFIPYFYAVSLLGIENIQWLFFHNERIDGIFYY